MTRGGFLRTAGFAVGAITAAGLVGGGVAKSAPPFGSLNPVDGYYEVYPFGDAFLDLSNVQLAVLGMQLVPDVPPNPPYPMPIPGFTGKVRLKAGTFNFNGTNPILGTPGVVLPYPVALVGDGTDSDGNPRTVINGGGGFTSQPWGAVTVYSDGDIKIDGLWFQDQTLAAVGSFKWNSLEITNNRITGVKPVVLPPYSFGPEQPFDFESRLPIGIMGQGATGSPGAILLAGNVLDNTGAFSTLLGADTGITTALTNDSLEIFNNQIKSLGICVYTTMNFGTTRIESNALTSTPPLFDAAIWCFYNKSARIAGNTINLPAGSLGSGLSLSNMGGDAFELSGNLILMGSGLAAIHMGDPGGCFFAPPLPLQGALIRNNKIQGSAMHALVAFDYPPIPPLTAEPFANASNSNEVAGNNMTAFTPTGGFFGTPPVHVFLGPYTYNNDLRGYFGGTDSVVDLNPTGPYADQPNHITGCAPMKGAGGIGSAISGSNLANAAKRTIMMGGLLQSMGKAAEDSAGKLKQQFGQ